MKLPNQDLELRIMLKNKLINGEVVDLKIGYSTSLIICNAGVYYNVSIGNSEIHFEDQIGLINVEDIVSKLFLGKLFKKHISSLDVDENGNLSIEFDKDIKVLTKFGTNYEAWEINGPDRFQVVCMPGGTLAYWNQ